MIDFPDELCITFLLYSNDNTLLGDLVLELEILYIKNTTYPQNFSINNDFSSSSSNQELA